MTDEQLKAWNEALASGDQERINRLRGELLTDIFTRIMNDDDYTVAGWKP